MDHAATPPHWTEEYRVNLARDGGRRVMFGGNAYEDDLEPADSSPDGEPRLGNEHGLP
jgi:hypothetical protein